MYSRSSIYLTIIVAFLASAILSSQYISKYDRLKTSDKGYHDHVMIKSPIANHWNEADELLKDIKSGKSYFTSGKEHYDEFLPARLLALYYYITGYEIIDSNKNFKINNGKYKNGKEDGHFIEYRTEITRDTGHISQIKTWKGGVKLD